ncbi:hypothetical protein HZB88_03990 [archaeon]|nr:hypothetical protein [archaeon]
MNKDITSRNIGEIMCRPTSSIKIILRRLSSLNLLELKKKGRPLDGIGHSCDIFKVTPDGDKLIEQFQVEMLKEATTVKI